MRQKKVCCSWGMVLMVPVGAVAVFSMFAMSASWCPFWIKNIDGPIFMVPPIIVAIIGQFILYKLDYSLKDPVFGPRLPRVNQQAAAAVALAAQGQQSDLAAAASAFTDGKQLNPMVSNFIKKAVDIEANTTVRKIHLYFC